MRSILGSFFSFSRKHRRRTMGIVLWLLWRIRDAEDDEMQRLSDQLDDFEFEMTEEITFDYAMVEDAYLSCQYALGYLNSAIEDLEYVY